MLKITITKIKRACTLALSSRKLWNDARTAPLRYKKLTIGHIRKAQKSSDSGSKEVDDESAKCKELLEIAFDPTKRTEKYFKGNESEDNNVRLMTPQTNCQQEIKECGDIENKYHENTLTDVHRSSINNTTQENKNESHGIIEELEKKPSVDSIAISPGIENNRFNLNTQLDQNTTLTYFGNDPKQWPYKGDLYRNDDLANTIENNRFDLNTQLDQNTPSTYFGNDPKQLPNKGDLYGNDDLGNTNEKNRFDLNTQLDQNTPSTYVGNDPKQLPYKGDLYRNDDLGNTMEKNRFDFNTQLDQNTPSTYFGNDPKQLPFKDDLDRNDALGNTVEKNRFDFNTQLDQNTPLTYFGNDPKQLPYKGDLDRNDDSANTSCTVAGENTENQIEEKELENHETVPSVSKEFELDESKNKVERAHLKILNQSENQIEETESEFKTINQEEYTLDGSEVVSLTTPFEVLDKERHFPMERGTDTTEKLPQRSHNLVPISLFQGPIFHRKLSENINQHRTNIDLIDSDVDNLITPYQVLEREKHLPSEVGTETLTQRSFNFVHHHLFVGPQIIKQTNQENEHDVSDVQEITTEWKTLDLSLDLNETEKKREDVDKIEKYEIQSDTITNYRDNAVTFLNDESSAELKQNKDIKTEPQHLSSSEVQHKKVMEPHKLKEPILVLTKDVDNKPKSEPETMLLEDMPPVRETDSSKSLNQSALNQNEKASSSAVSYIELVKQDELCEKDVENTELKSFDFLFDDMIQFKESNKKVENLINSPLPKITKNQTDIAKPLTTMYNMDSDLQSNTKITDQKLTEMDSHIGNIANEPKSMAEKKEEKTKEEYQVHVRVMMDTEIKPKESKTASSEKAKEVKPLGLTDASKSKPFIEPVSDQHILEATKTVTNPINALDVHNLIPTTANVSLPFEEIETKSSENNEENNVLNALNMTQSKMATNTKTKSENPHKTPQGHFSEEIKNTTYPFLNQGLLAKPRDKTSDSEITSAAPILEAKQEQKEIASMNQLLKQLRQRIKQQLSGPVESKCGDKPPTCPPPAPVCPPPDPCPPPKCPPKKPKCPSPCKPKCPDPCKPPCAKFLGLRDVTELILGKLGILPTRQIHDNENCGLEVSEHNAVRREGRKKSECFIITIEHRNKVEDIAQVKPIVVNEICKGVVVDYLLGPRDFRPWSPIPSMEIPMKEPKRPLQCPKEGCKLIPPPRLNPPCNENPCINFPKRDSFSQLVYNTDLF